MSAYVVFTRTKTIDQKELEKYRTGIKATMKDHPIEVLVADGKHEVLEGDPIEGMVIVKFPSVKAAKDWCGWRIRSMTEFACAVQSCARRRSGYRSTHARAAAPGDPLACHPRETLPSGWRPRPRSRISTSQTSAADQ